MPKRTIKPVDRPIKAVFDEFLSEQRQRLKDKTFNRYRSVIQLFEASMDGYAPQYLDNAEMAAWEQRYNARGSEHREFCEFFGAEKIAENVREFLNYFMPRKVMCGQDLLRAAGTVTKKLGKWLVDKGYIETDRGDDMADSGARASKDLPAAEALARMLAAYAQETTTPFTDRTEAYFGVRAVGPASLALETATGEAKMIVPVPTAAAEACKPGWTIAGCVGKTAHGWRLVEVWNVYS